MKGTVSPQKVSSAHEVASSPDGRARVPWPWATEWARIIFSALFHLKSTPSPSNIAQSSSWPGLWISWGFSHCSSG